MYIAYFVFRVTWTHKGFVVANVGRSVELGLNLSLDTCSLISGLDALQLQRYFRDWKPNGKATRQIQLLGLRRINRRLFIGLYNDNRSVFLSAS